MIELRPGVPVLGLEAVQTSKIATAFGDFKCDAGRAQVSAKPPKDLRNSHVCEAFGATKTMPFAHGGRF